MPAFDQITLHTPRLLLRPLRESDVPALFGIFSDPYVTRYQSRPPWTSLDQAREHVAKDQRALPAGEYLRLGLERRATGELIGECSLFNLSAQCRRAEIGYTLGAAAWGQGYMNEALLALLDYGFSGMDLNRVEADIDPRNENSAKSLLRLGFKDEGLLRERWIVSGEVSDSGLYGLLLRDWQARQAVPARNP